MGSKHDERRTSLGGAGSSRRLRAAALPVALLAAGCSAEVGITELAIDTLSLHHGQNVRLDAPTVGVELHFDGPDGRPCYHLSSEVRVTLDDILLDNSYLGGYNGKSGSCNRSLTFIHRSVPRNDAPRSALVFEDDSGRVSTTFVGLRARHEATLREPADGHIHPNEAVLIDLNRPDDTYEYVTADVMNEDLSGYPTDPNGVEIVYEGGTLALTIESAPAKPANIAVPIKIVVSGKWLPDVEECPAKECSAEAEFQVAIPAVLEL